MADGKDSMSTALTFIFNIWRYTAVFLLVAAAACGVFWLVSQPAGLKISIPVTFTVDTTVYRVTAPSLGIQDAQVQGPTDGIGFEIGRSASAKPLRVRASLLFPARRDGFVAANLAILFAFLGVIIWVLARLRDLFRTIRDGEPFARANAARIRSIAIAVIGGELARAAVTVFEDHYVMAHFVAEGLHFVAPLHVNVFAMINGLIILVIAEVFRAGTRLDEEQSLTV